MRGILLSGVSGKLPVAMNTDWALLIDPPHKEVSLLLLPRPNRSGVCSKFFDLKMWNDSLSLGSMDHLNEVTRNQYE